ncbi:MAG: hypothetical protein ACRES7_06370 [Gammaproteobacteria bacterium]
MTTIAGMVLTGVAASAATVSNASVTYSPPDMTDISAAQLKKYYAWRDRMDWLLAPIHSRAELDAYLKTTAGSGSPLDVLAPDARRRFLASLQFGRGGLAGFSTADLQYLSAEQVYQILSLFGQQGYTPDIAGNLTRTASPRTRSQPVKPSTVQKRFDVYWDFIRQVGAESSAEEASPAGREYEKLFASDQKEDKIRSYDESDVRLLLRAAGMAAFATREAEYSRDMVLDLNELERRHAAVLPDYRQTYEALINTRLFAAAQKFYAAHPSAARTPPPDYLDEAGVVEPGTPTVLMVSTTQREVIRRPVALDASAQVVILTDPQCHFCAYFLDALQSRPQLRRLLEEHALWITPPSGVLDFDTLQQWDRAHPAERIDIMYRLQEWPMVKDLAAPTFYFLQNGSLVTTVVGWPRNGNFEKLQAALKKIGLL